METSDGQEIARGRLAQVYQFLQALDQRRNVPQRLIRDQLWALWLHDLPAHPCICCPAIQRASEDDAPARHSDVQGEDYLLKVGRPQITHCPPPPDSIREWLERGWDNPANEAVIRPQRAIREEDNELVGEEFHSEPERAEEFTRWKLQRDGWADHELPARQTMAIFERLYALKARLDREAERVELMLGDGLLHWPATNGLVHHPILLQRVQLVFDPAIPEFTILDAERPPELYLSLLRCIEGVDFRALSRCRQELEEKYWHPLGDAESDAYFQRVVSQLAPRGEFVGKAEPTGEHDAPQIGRNAVFFLRQRTLGFSSFIEGILEDLPTRSELPEAAQNIVGVDTTRRPITIGPPEQPVGDNPDGEDENVLFTKEANAEQLQVAQRLERYGSVLVQGPPGTGKTHTIANLIGHLLAEGKSVLVTSHTAKALHVLRDKVVDHLQPLCVSVLADSRSQLDDSVQAITERLSSADANQLDSDANECYRERADLIARLRDTRRLLRNARQDEYRPIVVGGEQFTPSDAARLVANTAQTDDWIPASVTEGAPLPITPSELADLYGTNATVTAQDEVELAQALPELTTLVPPLEFGELVSEKAHLLTKDLDCERGLWHDTPSEQSSSILQLLQQRLAAAVEALDETVGWRLAAISAGREGEAFRRPWDDLPAHVESVNQQAGEAHGMLLRYVPKLPAEMATDDADKILGEILTHLDAGRGLGWLVLATKRSWKDFIARVLLDGRQPKTREHFEALRAFVRLRQARFELIQVWDSLMTRHGAPSASGFGDEPERVCRQWTTSIRTALSWHQETWVPLCREMSRQGFQWEKLFHEIPPNLHPDGELLRIREAVLQHLPDAFTFQANRLRHTEVQDKLRRLALDVDKASAGVSTADVVMRLRDAITVEDVGTYRQAYDRLTELYQRSIALCRRRELLAKMDATAPMWASAIKNRRDIHAAAVPPGDGVTAWRWRQLNDELERRAATSIEELQRRIADLKYQLPDVTGRLVEHRAWASQIRRTTLTQRQALQGFAKVMKRIGKGTGRRVPELRAEAQRLTPICQSAVPVWIMPLSRVVETFDPRRNQFDVIIIDEASQADLMALSVLYMAKQVVIVGDDKQATPIPVSEDIKTVTDLVATYLDGIPNNKLYDGRTSIYDLAETSFGGAVVLREHFRCVPPIIEFSNQLSYSGKIKPLRDASGVLRKPHTIAYRVEGAVSGGKVNEQEAIVVASLLLATAEQKEYADATFGVISMVGEEQAARIDAILRQRMTFSEYISRAIQCGNAAQFQGDERDVVFLSLVDAPTGNGPLTLRADGADDMFKKRYNVAASRARDQMWVVHSVDPDNDLKPDDIRRRLILHARNPYAFSSQLAAKEKETESEFERQVLGRLMRAGYRVTPQYHVGAYRIDMVVTGGGKQLAVECDGDRWHTGIDKLNEDMERQTILERIDWKFVRLRGSQFFRDPDKAMKAVFRRLESLNIPAEGSETDAAGADSAQDDLRQRIFARAETLRQEWKAETDDSAPSHFDQTSLRMAIVPDKGKDETGGSIQYGGKPSARATPAQTDIVSPLTTVYRQETADQAPNQSGMIPVPNSGDPRKPEEAAATMNLMLQPSLSVEQEPNLPPQAESVQSNLFPPENDRFSLVEFLRSQGLTFTDKRQVGGALWVIGDMELQDTMQYLTTKGYVMQYLPNGSKSTNHRPAWWTSAKY